MSRAKSQKTEEQQAIEQLQGRFDNLSHERTRIGAQKESAQKQLEDLQQAAVEEFGTHDLAELEKQLNSMKIENEKKRSDYQASLDEIEKKLSEIESQFSGRDDVVGEN